MKIFKTSMYRGVFNSLTHFDEEQISLDISRTSEIIDILHSNIDNIMNDIRDCLKLYKQDMRKAKK